MVSWCARRTCRWTSSSPSAHSTDTVFGTVNVETRHPVHFADAVRAEPGRQPASERLTGDRVMPMAEQAGQPRLVDRRASRQAAPVVEACAARADPDPGGQTALEVVVGHRGAGRAAGVTRRR
jgi:hypothetical protein